MDGTTERGRAGEEATLRLVQHHAAELLRFARRFSLCADDAHDAYQRSVEILVRRMRTAPPENPLSWLRTVLRHEAYTVRREREQLVGRDEVDLDRHESRDVEDPADLVAGAERLDRVAEALQRLKPQEVTALVLRSEGLSYKEIGARQSWTYTKVNRAITEGRRALRDRLEAIESGAECERWLPQLSALADGEASMRQRAELRPHLRACPACRATLRGFQEAPRQVAALVPVALLPAATLGDPASTAGHLAAVVHALVERATFAATRVQGAVEAVSGTKVAAVAASTAAIAGGGAALERAVDRPVARAEPVARVAGAGSVVAAQPALPVAGPAPAADADTAASKADPSGDRATGGEFAPEVAAPVRVAEPEPAPESEPQTQRPASQASTPSEFGLP